MKLIEPHRCEFPPLPLSLSLRVSGCPTASLSLPAPRGAGGPLFQALSMLVSCVSLAPLCPLRHLVYMIALTMSDIVYYIWYCIVCLLWIIISTRAETVSVFCLPRKECSHIVSAHLIVNGMKDLLHRILIFSRPQPLSALLIIESPPRACPGLFFVTSILPMARYLADSYLTYPLYPHRTLALAFWSSTLGISLKPLL